MENKSEKHPAAGTAPEDFGLALAARRRQMGLSIDQVSRKTNITWHTLARIESQEIASLPPPVFMKGFLRTYAELLEMDAGEILGGYLETKRLFDQGKERIERRRRWLSSALAISLFGIFIGMSVALAAFLTSNWGPARSQPESAAMESPRPAGPKTVKKPFSKPLNLVAVASSPTWVKAMIDGQAVKKWKLEKGERLALKAARGFNLLLGDCSAITLWLDKKAIAVPCRPGRPANVALP